MLREHRELRIPWRGEHRSSKQVRFGSPDQVSTNLAGLACSLELARPRVIHVQPEDRTLQGKINSLRVALMYTNSTVCTDNAPEDRQSASGQRDEDLEGQVGAAM